MALLVGTNQLNATLLNHSFLSVGEGLYSQTSLVPELEGKAGINYTYSLAQGDFTLDAGYSWQNYFNAQIVFATVGVDQSDFGLQGPYVGIKYVGYV